MKTLLSTIPLLSFSMPVLADSLVLHTYSHHSFDSYYETNISMKPTQYNSSTVGLGYITDSNWQFGAYYNSYKKPTVYFGKSFMYDVGSDMFGRKPQIGFSILGATGYKERSGYDITPMLSLNFSLPVSEKVTTNVSLLPMYQTTRDGKKYGAVTHITFSYKF